MTDRPVSLVRERQDPLRARYRTTPGSAAITDCARTRRGTKHDAFHGIVQPGDADHEVDLPFGIHRAIGGDHDLPNPGDILCAALGSCLDSTIRIIADRMGLSLADLRIEVTARLDVRGTLMVDRDVRTGFQSMRCDVHVDAAEGTDPEMLRKLLGIAEQCCVVMDTLRSGVAVETRLVAQAAG